MSTVLCHFYNEEYLLPWWLNHHKNLFEDGIMVNRGSTDRSVEIIREIVPHWKVIDSFSNSFDAALCDLEMSWLEKDLKGWKIILNVTEFLILSNGVNLKAIEQAFDELGKYRGIFFPGYIMVDDDPLFLPTYDISLVSQKYFGLPETLISPEIAAQLSYSPLPQRARLYHCASIGSYTPGRHSSHLPDTILAQGGAAIFWYGFSPWNEKAIKRKLQIKNTMSEGDIKVNLGIQHLQSLEELEKKKLSFESLSINLKEKLKLA